MGWPLQKSDVAAAYLAACRGELAALKPGNVHVHADPETEPGRSVAEFEKSAEVSAPHIANPILRTGARIRRAVEATHNAVGTNTNLGIVLLAAPLAVAAQSSSLDKSLRPRLSRVIAGLTVADADDAFRAIAGARPAGLGGVPEGDVTAPATMTLREAMALAAGRDRIASAYATDFEDNFATGLPFLTRARAEGYPREEATTGLHLAFLSAFPDTHIARKHGDEAARRVMELARAHKGLWRREAGATGRHRLLDLDRTLKAHGLNPGTTADLVVATLFADGLITIAEGGSPE